MMNEELIYEVDSDDISLSSFKLRNNLNQKIWENDKLDGEVRLQLLDIADDFIDYLNIKWVKPIDIKLVGSICNYNWSKISDVDLHIIMDFSKIFKKKEIVQDFLDMKKNEWNNNHQNLTIYGFNVELYVEDIKDDEKRTEPSYSLEKNKWVKEPDLGSISPIQKKDAPKIKRIAAELMTKIDDIAETYNTARKDEMDDLIDTLENILKFAKEQRSNSLKHNKTMGVGNIVYKILRREGYIDKIRYLINICYDKANSI